MAEHRQQVDTVASEEAENRFIQLLDRVSRGESVRITRGGKPIARLVPEDDPDYARVIGAIERILRGRAARDRIASAEIRGARHEGHRY